MSTIGAIGAGWCHALRLCGLAWSPIMSTIGAIAAGWVSRGWGWSPSHWGRVGVTRFWPVVSHTLHERNRGHWGRVGVTRFGPVVSGSVVTRFGPVVWSPIMSTIGAVGVGWVSRAEHNWGHWGRVGVTRLGPVVSHALRSGAQLGPLGPGGCHALQRASSLCSPMVHNCEAIGAGGYCANDRRPCETTNPSA